MAVAPELSVEELREALAQVSTANSDAARIEQIAELERIKAVACAVQARVTAEFAASQRAQLAAAGCSDADAGRSIGSQIALARRESPTRGSRHLGFAEALCSDMPGTLAVLGRGETSEWRATLVVRETAILSRGPPAGRGHGTRGRLPQLGDTQAEREARRIGMRLDPDAAARRARRAVQGRRVTIRPAPDAMTSLTAILPVAEGVACYASLTREADLHTPSSEGGPARSRSQIMADTLTDRILGRTPNTDAGTDTGAGEPAAGEPTGAEPTVGGRGVSVEVQLIITDRTLLGGGPEPAEIPGHGPIPAHLARQLVADTIERGTVDDRTSAFVRRLFTDPTGTLVAAESRRRRFPPGMARFIRTRDGGTCRTPWCNAPIRHTDHITPAETGGPTSLTNGQGFCERCNYTKQVIGWTSTPEGDGGISIATPTGHTYTSRPPPVPGVA